MAQQVEELSKQGCRVKVVSPLPWVPYPLARLNSRWEALRKVPSQAVIKGIEVYYPRIPILPKNWSRFLTPFFYRFSLGRLIRQLKHSFSPNLIHAHTGLPDGAAGLSIARRLGVPLIVTIHGYDLHPRNLLNLIWRRMLKRIIAGADRVVYVSSYLERIAREELGLIGNEAIIHNGVPLKCLEERKRGDLQEQVVLAVGNLIPQKGFQILLQSFSLLVRDCPETVVKIIGDGPEEERLKELAKSLGIEAKVRFLGKLPHSEVMREMASCSLFCLPSWNEGFGLVYLEAMSLGKPVIGCRGQGIEDGILDGINGFLVIPEDVGGLAFCLRDLLLDKQLREEMGRVGRGLVKERFALDREAGELRSLYRKVLIDHNRNREGK